VIDPKKNYRTRDGREVRIYAVDGGDEFCVHGAILIDGIWCQRSWPISGIIGFKCKSDADLIEVKPRIKREVWVNVYPDRIGIVCESKEEADNATGAKSCLRIACVKLVIDCEEGEGL
jgi:hypothetical protein